MDAKASHTMHGGGAFGLVDPVFVLGFGPGFCSIPAIIKSGRFVAIELLYYGVDLLDSFTFHCENRTLTLYCAHPNSL